MRGIGLFGLLIGISIAFAFQSVFAQTNDVYTSDQTTLSEDLKNNPVAQDILKKIEQTKQWIAELEQREYEELQAKEELEQKRTDALEKLNQDLEEWEKLWEYYSPRNSFGRFVETIPSKDVQGVFWDQFEFHEMKVKAGRAALKQVFANGGSLSEARDAYHRAAETKRIELIEANSMFNVNHNLAYYNQQILFNTQGQYVETPVTGEQLRKYYEDYRSNPAYLEANPDDAVSWDELGETTPNTECRDGYIVVYRFHSRDYVCVTESTAEMWIRHGMGEISGNSTATSFNPVNPLTNCDAGMIPVFVIESENYSCIMQDTADQWVEQGIAEIHEPESYIKDRIGDKEAQQKVYDINEQIQELKFELQEKQAELKKEYDRKYDEALEESKKAERQATKEYNERTGMTKEELSKKIISIREQYRDTKDALLDEKQDALQRLEETYKDKVKHYVDSFEFDSDIKIVWNSAKSSYEAIKNQN